MDKDISWCEDFIFNMEYIRHVKKVYALRVPVYYYVKTPGSLASQGTSISKTIRMKKMVFKCYNDFYKDVFEEEDYEKIRLQVYRFLIDAAGDGSVGPTILPSSMKLGNERISLSLSVREGDGILFDAYRESRLLDRYLETVAIKYELAFEDVKLMFYLSQNDEACTMEEMSEITRISKIKLIASAQKLILKKYLKLKDPQELEKKKEKDKMEYEILKEAEPVISDLLAAKTAYLQIKYSGLSDEEIEQYEMLSEKIRGNIQKTF